MTVALAIAVLLIVRPELILRWIWKLPGPSSYAVFEPLAGLPPYKWLLSGHSFETVRREAPHHPEMSPRVLLVYRLLGASVFVVAAAMAIISAVIAIA
jgi:hypothetical protein